MNEITNKAEQAAEPQYPTREQIKAIIIDDTKNGEPFYPSDIAINHGIDLEDTYAAIGELIESGKIITLDD